MMQGAGQSIPRWMGGIAVVFGLLVLWQPLYLSWILGGLLIIIGLVGLLLKKTVIIPVIMLVIGAVIIFLPSLIIWTVALAFIVIGLVFGLMRTGNKLRQGIGLTGALVGLLIIVMPSLLGLIAGIALIGLGFVILVGGLEE
jgi:hypothetical protein